MWFFVFTGYHTTSVISVLVQWLVVCVYRSWQLVCGEEFTLYSIKPCLLKERNGFTYKCWRNSYNFLQLKLSLLSKCRDRKAPLCSVLHREAIPVLLFIMCFSLRGYFDSWCRCFVWDERNLYLYGYYGN